MNMFFSRCMGWCVVLAVMSAALLFSPLASAHPEKPMDSNASEKEAPSQSMPMMKMMKKQKKAFDRLDEKLSTMKQAHGEQRIDAMAEVIEELVAQRRSQMRMRMGMMHMCMGMMKGQMMEKEGSMMNGSLMNQGHTDSDHGIDHGHENSGSER